MSNLVELKRQRDKLIQEARALLAQADLTSRRIDHAEQMAKLEDDEEEFEDSWDESWMDSGC